MDPRFVQAHREARWTLVLTLAYLLTWFITAYYLGDQPGVFGFPRWFELSCLFAPLFFIVLCALMVINKFRDIPLDDQNAN